MLREGENRIMKNTRAGTADADDGFERESEEHEVQWQGRNGSFSRPYYCVVIQFELGYAVDGCQLAMISRKGISIRSSYLLLSCASGVHQL
jgi:hypothetical protein